MITADIVQSCKDVYLVDIDLDNLETGYSSLANLLKEIYSLSGTIFSEWSQYIDHGIGSIYFCDEKLKLIWEDFSNTLIFKKISFENANLFTEKLAMM